MSDILAFGQTDIGRIRAVNQDSYLVHEQQQLFIVADGMGGHAGGEIASKMAVDEISRYLNDQINKLRPTENSLATKDEVICESLMAAINRASRLIYEKALEDPSLRGMGTTVTLLKLKENKAYFGHVGDSRLYLFRQGFLYVLTNDHSLVSEQVRAGLLTEEEAELHQLRNVITRSVGYQEEEDVDASVIELEPDDCFLLCSDGLHGKVNDQELAAFLKMAPSDGVGEMIALANKRGGDDNITAIVVQIRNT